MKKSFETKLYSRIHEELNKIKIVNTHEHLQRNCDLPQGENIHIGRFFIQYASSDLINAGLPLDNLKRVRDDVKLSPTERWALLEPWYKKAYNTAYCETLRIALQDLYGVEDFSHNTVDAITDKMQTMVKTGFNRTIFDKAGIDFAMNQPLSPDLVFNYDDDTDCFIYDLVDHFTGLDPWTMSKQIGLKIDSLDDYLKAIDYYFEKHGHYACAFKVGMAYNRTLAWEDIAKECADDIFARYLTKDKPDAKDMQKLQDFLMHHLCKMCGKHNLRMKFHTGLQEGIGNDIKNSRAALLTNLFLKYPETKFDIYHISYPYQEEAITLAKIFPNVTINFCWMWIINPAAARRALSDMLDTVPANKIHGFGGDFIFAEGSYGHAVIARREIARVLCEKVEEGRFTESYAVEIGQMLLRDNAIENFDLEKRRKAFKDHIKNNGIA